MKNLLITLLTAITMLGCDNDNDKKKKGKPQPTATHEAINPPSRGNTKSPSPYQVPSPKTVTTTKEEVEAGFSLFKQDPEQIFKTLEMKTGMSYKYFNPAAAREISFAFQLLGVSLGGIDFVTTSFKDRSSKIQTLLTSRVLAWIVARDGVASDISRSHEDRIIINTCQMETDRPWMPGDESESAATQSSIREGEKKWEEQVEDLFWRFYSRPPSNEEMQWVREAFIEAATYEPDMAIYNGKGIAGAWMVVIYALVASQEFWHI